MATPTQTLRTPALVPADQYYAGRADAYDEHAAGTPLTILDTRSKAMAEHPSLAYALGYTDRVLEIQRETAHQTTAQTELAYQTREEHQS